MPTQAGQWGISGSAVGGAPGGCPRNGVGPPGTAWDPLALLASNAERDPCSSAVTCQEGPIATPPTHLSYPSCYAQAGPLQSKDNGAGMCFISHVYLFKPYKSVKATFAAVRTSLRQLQGKGGQLSRPLKQLSGSDTTTEQETTRQRRTVN